jgi:hypothetical protein
MNRDPDPAATAIKARLEALQWALDTSKFEPEATNIRCAMEGYKSGAITYSTHYTLIWGGKIVGTAPHYRTFTAGRSARLDRYLETYGPGWFFYEEPLKVHPSLKPKLCKSVTLSRNHEINPLQLFHVVQGFWKRANYVKRMDILTSSMPVMPSPEDQIYMRDMEGNVDCGNVGPRIAFKTLLDSGATYPTLHNEDLLSLGVNPLFYGAQSVQSMLSASGVFTTRIYELWVSVLNNEGEQLVDENDPVFPRSHKFLGGLCPVAQSSVPLRYDENGIEHPCRLSGVFPFLACYMSSTPTRNMLFLGEDRNDVLGNHRMPGQRKWTIEMPSFLVGLPLDRYDNPHITFRHRGGEIVDMDREDKKHASTLTIRKGQPGEQVFESDPADAQLLQWIESEIEAYESQVEDMNVQGPQPSIFDPSMNRG